MFIFLSRALFVRVGSSSSPSTKWLNTFISLKLQGRSLRQSLGEAFRSDSGLRASSEEIKPWLLCSSALRCWASYLASLSLCFPIYKIGMSRNNTLGAYCVLGSDFYCFPAANSTLRRLLLRGIRGLVIKFFFSGFRLPLSSEVVKSL